MKKILLALTLLFSSCAFAGSELELNKVKLPEAISLIYSEVLKVPYMLGKVRISRSFLPKLTR